jgi:hypothetical protein
MFHKMIDKGIVVEYYPTNLVNMDCLSRSIFVLYPRSSGEKRMKKPAPKTLAALYAAPWGLWARTSTSVCMAALVAACGGGGGASVTPTPTPVLPDTGGSGGVGLTASSNGQLLSYVKTKIKQGGVQASESTNAVGGVATGALVPSAAPAPAVASAGATATPAPAPAPAPAAAGATAVAADAATFSGTRLQEVGVEEDDLVKTDASMLYALSMPYWTGTTTVPAQLQARQRQADGQLAAAAKLGLGSDISHTGFYLASSAQRLAVLGQTSYSGLAQPGIATPAAPPSLPAVSTSPVYVAFSSKIALDVVSLSNPGSLSITHRIRIDGQMVGSRMVGSTLYVVSTWNPDLSRYALPANASATEADTRLAGLSSGDVLPTIQVDNQPSQPLLPDTDCYVQASNASSRVQITSITAFDLGSPSVARSSRCFVGEAFGMYMSPSNVYLSSSRFYTYPTDASAAVFSAGGTQTDIHKFALQGAQITYKASGVVPGHLGWDREKLPSRMSEYQGDLRVVSFTGERGWNFAAPLPLVLPPPPTSTGSGSVAVTTATGTAISATPSQALPVSPATLTVLRENTSKGFDSVGSLPSTRRPAPLGKPGEQVYAVQFVGPRAYVVTFRQTDPLYVLDVSDPADPKTLGELAMPGFSDYLYPLGDKLLLGVGKDANNAGQLGGVKVALMDVTDPTRPAVINSSIIGYRGSYSALDFSRHGINIFQQGSVFRVALPARVNDSPFGSPSYQGLHRYEVDSVAKTMVSKPTLKSINFPAPGVFAPNLAQFDISSDRSVQIGVNLYYFSGGAFLASLW